jgi:hypothetical protein
VEVVVLDSQQLEVLAVLEAVALDEFLIAELLQLLVTQIPAVVVVR